MFVQTFEDTIFNKLGHITIISDTDMETQQDIFNANYKIIIYGNVMEASIMDYTRQCNDNSGLIDIFKDNLFVLKIDNGEYVDCVKLWAVDQPESMIVDFMEENDMIPNATIDALFNGNSNDNELKQAYLSSKIYAELHALGNEFYDMYEPELTVTERIHLTQSINILQRYAQKRGK